MLNCGETAPEMHEDEDSNDNMISKIRRFAMGIYRMFNRGEAHGMEDLEVMSIPIHNLQQLIAVTAVHWAEEAVIESPVLVREIFALLHRQHDCVRELCRAMEKTYCISEASSKDTYFIIEPRCPN